MNKICKEYLSDAKEFFPVIGKGERAFLRNMVSPIEDCIELENITTKQELYVKYRQPYDLASDYYNKFETEDIVKKIKISKYIKVFISILVIAVLIATSVFIYFWTDGHKISEREEMVANNNVLETTDTDDIDIKSDNFDELNGDADEEIVGGEEIIE